MSLPNYQMPVVDSPVDYSRLHTAEWIQARIAELQKLRPDPLIALAPGAPKDQERLFRGIARELCTLRDELELVKRLGVGAKWRPIDALPRTTPLNVARPVERIDTRSTLSTVGCYLKSGPILPLAVGPHIQGDDHGIGAKRFDQFVHQLRTCQGGSVYGDPSGAQVKNALGILD